MISNAFVHWSYKQQILNSGSFPSKLTEHCYPEISQYKRHRVNTNKHLITIHEPPIYNNPIYKDFFLSKTILLYHQSQLWIFHSFATILRQFVHRHTSMETIKRFFVKWHMNILTINSLRLGDAYMRKRTRLSLVQVMTCRLFGA